MTGAAQNANHPNTLGGTVRPAQRERGVFVVQTQSVPGREEEFAIWYDEEHIPRALRVLEDAGFVSARRFVKVHDAGLPLDGWSETFVIYEIEAEDLDAAAKTVAEGRSTGKLGPGELVQMPVRFQLYREAGGPITRGAESHSEVDGK
jgi:hypothetical protein